MLTRLKVSGFKNLVDVDVQFGPFTCIAGANGVGKSNLFDAIRFLNALAHGTTLVQAARTVRDEEGRSADIRDVFHRVGANFDRTMTFESEMIVPQSGEDDLGQEAEANATFLRYRLELSFRGDAEPRSPDPIEIVREELTALSKAEAKKGLRFLRGGSDWFDSAIHYKAGWKANRPIIATEGGDERREIRVHQEGHGGRQTPSLARRLPRTVLSSVNAADSPTALLARREMQSWRLLHLEPSALRRADDFIATPSLGADGEHLPATLYRLANSSRDDDGEPDPERVYCRVANRLSELIGDVKALQIDSDPKRELYTLVLSDRQGTQHPARSLSDGTLRFLALAVLYEDPDTQGVLCFEEPENGIHPDRIPAMLRLLKDIAVDTDFRVSPDNPLRQVIINTHSPSVVGEVADADLLVAESREVVREGARFQRAAYSPLPDTWRVIEGIRPVSKGQLLGYLNPKGLTPHSLEIPPQNGSDNGQVRVIDRSDLRQMRLGL
jgi:predicted ATPase